MKTLFIAVRALLFMAGFVLLWGWVALRVRTWDAALEIVLPPWARVPGTIFMALGGVLALACGAFFVAQGRGTPAPFDAPRKFVAVGPYKYVRNPMYIGALLLLLGFGMYQRSVSILLFSLAWFVLAHLFVILYEEPTLQRKFNGAYSGYCRSVPRWIPKRQRPGAL